MSLAQDLSDMITPVVEGAGYRLWDLSVTKAGKRTVISITLDREGGATLDGIAEASKLIAPILDDHASLIDAYHLEVSSPGLERSLTRPQHYTWSLHLDVTVSHRADGTLVRSRGKIVDVGENSLTLETQDSSIVISFEDITKAHTVFDFDAAMKAGSQSEVVPQGETA